MTPDMVANLTAVLLAYICTGLLGLILTLCSGRDDRYMPDPNHPAEQTPPSGEWPLVPRAGDLLPCAGAAPTPQYRLPVPGQRLALMGQPR